jgi:hypothetical protein
LWAFSVPPPFYRTGAFYLTGSLRGGPGRVGRHGGCGLRSVKHSYTLAFDERARVSREIHDTLLQSLGGVALELEAVAVELDRERPWPPRGRASAVSAAR